MTTWILVLLFLANSQLHVLCLVRAHLQSPSLPLPPSNLAVHALQSTRAADIDPVLAGKALLDLPKDRNALSNRLFFSWVSSIMALGNKKPLEMHDLWRLPENELMGNLSATFESFFEFEKKQANITLGGPAIDERRPMNVLHEFWASPLTKAIVKMYRRPLVSSGLMKLMNTLVQFLPSLLIARILGDVDGVSAVLDRQALLQRGILLSVSLFLALCAKTFMENQYFYTVIDMGASIRGVLSAAIYRKSLRLSPAGRQNNTAGEIVNYMQLDTSRMEQVVGTIHVVWDGLLQVAGYTGLLLHFLGPSVLAGIAAMLVIIPLNAVFLKKLSGLRAENLRYTDMRVKLTNEILTGVRAIKSYNWEKPFVSQLTAIRSKELIALKRSANTRAILVSILSAAPSVVAVITLGVYALMGNVLTPTKVFTALALFNQLRFPLIFLPLLLNTLAEGKVSLRRLSKFLLADEVKKYVRTDDSTTYEGTQIPVAVRVDNASFAWTPSGSPNETSSRGQLRNVNITIRKGELVALIGPVGSGKSTLMSALLGELHKESGEVTVVGKVAYVPQVSWIPNDSFRNSILFGRQMENAKYRQTLQMCGLEQDISMLEYGDSTEIGERGITLSGGQKQRISLARAMYDDADLYLLDDPLSALDAEVGSKVFQNCIKGSLKNKTRLLATHQLNVLPEVDRIIILARLPDSSCYVVDQGTFSELTGRGHDLSKLVREDFVQKDVRDTIVSQTPLRDLQESDAIYFDKAAPSKEDCTSDVAENSPMDMGPALEDIDAAPEAVSNEMTIPDALSTTATARPTGKIMTTEERAEGVVGLHIYRAYLKAANKPVLMVMIVASFILANLTLQLQQWIVAAWTSDSGYVKQPLPVYLGSVAIMATSVALFNWSRTYLGWLFGAAASEKLHNDLTKRVLGAPLYFFESTPVGRLVQRFTKDLDQIDQQLPGSFGQMVASALNIVSSMLAITIVTPSFAVVMLPIMYIYTKITNYYRNVARELKRLDSLSRSPIFAHFSESLGGLSVIRTFSRQLMFQRSNEARLDDNMSAYYALKVVDRWLSVRLELLGNTIVFFSAIFAVISGSRAGAAGLSLNNALGVTSLLNWAVRNGAETESLMNSVERVHFTTNETPQERETFAAAISPSAFLSVATTQNASADEQSSLAIPLAMPRSDSDLITSGWPWKGGIVFRDAHMKYRSDFQPVLQGVNLEINPGEILGIVGRTASGKSSLFRALLRLTELDSGSIYIDGVNASAIGLDALRSSIAIIPQDPVLFSGSIRMNLDPFGAHSDEILWDALRKSNLEQAVRDLPGGLDFQVSEGGENFSLGQRQLICLARALVRRSRILLLDEATSSVDYETDSIIQRTIRDEFGGGKCTVLIIAHRLQTVMDADRILVMDKGRVGEFAAPRALLSSRSSLFAQLVAAEQSQDAGSARS